MVATARTSAARPLSLHRSRPPRRRSEAVVEVIDARSATDLAEVYRLRRRCFVRAGNSTLKVPHILDDDLLVDPVDAWSHHFLLRVDGIAAGCIRLTDERDGELECSAYLDLPRSDGEVLGELSRFLVVRDLRAPGARHALFRAAVERARELGLHRWLTVSEMAFARYYRTLGLRYRMADPFEHGAITTVPCCLMEGRAEWSAGPVAAG